MQCSYVSKSLWTSSQLWYSSHFNMNPFSCLEFEVHIYEFLNWGMEITCYSVLTSVKGVLSKFFDLQLQTWSY